MSVYSFNRTTVVAKSGKSNQLGIDFDKTIQLEIDFMDEEFQNKKVNTKFIPDISIELCHLCDKDKQKFSLLPIGLNGMNNIASPYSDLVAYVCEECYNKHDGDEVWSLYHRRRIIIDSIIASRFLIYRRVITEKKWDCMDADGFACQHPKKYKKISF